MFKKKTSSEEVLDVTSVAIEKLLGLCLFVPMGDPNSKEPFWGLPLLLWGPPGIGKTTRSKEFHRSIGLAIEAIIAAIRMPEDFGGAPVPDGKGGLNMVPTLPALKHLAGKSGTVFLDELGNTPHAVMGVLLDVVQTRRVGDMDLGPHVRMIAASNRPEDGAGRDLLPALANRFAHYDVGAPKASEFVEFLQGSAIRQQAQPYTAFEEQVKQGWNDAWARVSGVSAGFLHSVPDRVYQMPPVGSPQRGRAWASPRTWEMATRVAAAAECLEMSEDVRDVVMGGCVGTGPAGEWAEWKDKADLPDPYDVLEGEWEPNRTRLDISVAVLTSIASVVTSMSEDKKRTEFGVKAWHFLKRCLDAKGMADLVVAPAQTLVKTGMSNIQKGGPLAKAALPVLEQMSNTGLADIVDSDAAREAS